MNKQFVYNGVEFTACWNGKFYAGTTAFVEVKSSHDRYGHGTRMKWSIQRGWIENAGMPYANIVRDLMGFK